MKKFRIWLLLIALFALFTSLSYTYLTLHRVHYDPHEFMLCVKELIRGNLTDEEKAHSKMYQVYTSMNENTTLEEIDSYNHKVVWDLVHIWDYGYGSLGASTWGQGSENNLATEESLKITSKNIQYNTRQRTKLTDDELLVILNTNSTDDLHQLLGHPKSEGISFITSTPEKYSYTWLIKARITDDALALEGNHEDKFIQIPVTTEGATFNRNIRRNYNFRVSTDEDGNIIDITIDEGIPLFK